ncbi:MAG: hypothetical protein ABGZ24_09690, partial [Fuerstiella sp.]
MACKCQRVAVRYRQTIFPKPTGFNSTQLIRSGSTTMDKVLIVVGDATETLDTMYPYYRLMEAG